MVVIITKACFTSTFYGGYYQLADFSSNRNMPFSTYTQKSEDGYDYKYQEYIIGPSSSLLDLQEQQQEKLSRGKHTCGCFLFTSHYSLNIYYHHAVAVNVGICHELSNPFLNQLIQSALTLSSWGKKSNRLCKVLSFKSFTSQFQFIPPLFYCFVISLPSFRYFIQEALKTSNIFLKIWNQSKATINNYSILHSYLGQKSFSTVSQPNYMQGRSTLVLPQPHNNILDLIQL